MMRRLAVIGLLTISLLLAGMAAPPLQPVIAAGTLAATVTVV